MLEGGNYPHFKTKGAKPRKKLYSITIFLGPSVVRQSLESPSISPELPDSHSSGTSIFVKATENKDCFFDLEGRAQQIGLL